MIDCKDNVGGDLRNAEKYGEPSKAFGDNKQPAVTHVSQALHTGVVNKVII